MKKTLSLILALALCMVSLSVFAEEGKLGSDFSQDQITVQLAESISLPKAELDSESRAGKNADTVTNSNGVYSIRTPSGMSIKFDPRGLTFMTLTQSYYASYDVYGLFNNSKDADKYINNMISNIAHIIVWDMYDAFQYIALDTIEGDKLTRLVGNLASMSNSDINAVAGALASAVGVSDYDLYTFNGNVWIMLGANNLFTIVNSEYAHVQYIPNGNSMTKEDYSDFTDFMRSLKLS